MSSTNHSVSIEQISIGHPDTARICASLSSPDFDGAFGGAEAPEMSGGGEAGEGTKHSQSAAEALVPVQLEHSDSSIPIGTPVDDHPAPMVEACAEHSAGNLSWAEQSLESGGLCGVTLPQVDWLKGIELADPRDDQAEAAASVVVGKWAAKRYENAHAKLMMVGCKLSVATLMRCTHSPRPLHSPCYAHGSLTPRFGRMEASIMLRMPISLAYTASGKSLTVGISIAGFFEVDAMAVTIGGPLFGIKGMKGIALDGRRSSRA